MRRGRLQTLAAFKLLTRLRNLAKRADVRRLRKSARLSIAAAESAAAAITAVTVASLDAQNIGVSGRKQRDKQEKRGEKRSHFMCREKK